MPLWDNFARQAEALPVASYPTGGPHGADDFVAICQWKISKLV